MLTKEEYETLVVTDGCDAFRQVNHYFDTPDFKMGRSMTVIRIRVIGDLYELTVKTKNPEMHADGVVAMDENNMDIDESRAKKLLLGEDDIKDYLPKNLIHPGEALLCVGSITTIRKKIRIVKGMPMAELDKSTYDGITDYELEWEISEEKYNEAVGALKAIGIGIKGRPGGLSKYGRLVERLGKE
jgi:uncharacterized protein YjbK